MFSLTKRKRDDPPSLSYLDDEIEEIDDGDISMVRDLTGRFTVVIKDLESDQYMVALAALRSLGVLVMQDDALYFTADKAMVLDLVGAKVEEAVGLIKGRWVGPGRPSLETFIPSAPKTKVAIRAPRDADGSPLPVSVTLEAVVGYLTTRGIPLTQDRATLTLAAPGTWQLLVDQATAAPILALQAIIVSNVELSVGRWLDSFQNDYSLKVVVGNIADGVSRAGLTAYFGKLGTIVDVLHLKHEDGRYKSSSIITFDNVQGRDRALAVNGRKAICGQILSVVQSLSPEDRAAAAKKREDERKAASGRSTAAKARQKAADDIKARRQRARMEYLQAVEAQANAQPPAEPNPPEPTPPGQ